MFVRFLLILLLSIWSHFSTQANTFDIFDLLLLQNTTSFIFLSSFLFLSIYSFLFLSLYFILSPPFSLSSILSNFLFLSRPFSIFLPPSLPFCFVRPFSNYFTNFFLSPALSLFLPFSFAAIWISCRAFICFSRRQESPTAVMKSNKVRFLWAPCKKKIRDSNLELRLILNSQESP